MSQPVHQLRKGHGREAFASLHLTAWLGWTPPTGYLELVPEELRESGVAMAHPVCQVDLSGPAAVLAFPDIGDGGAIQQALLGAANAVIRCVG